MFLYFVGGAICGTAVTLTAILGILVLYRWRQVYRLHGMLGQLHRHGEAAVFYR